MAPVVQVHATAEASTEAAAAALLEALPRARTVMLAGGNTPLALYRAVAAAARASLSHLEAFSLDEYLGVPLEDPRTVANLLRREAVGPWGITRFHALPSLGPAEEAVAAHERRIAAAGGLDVAVLGLGRNGHVGFNEPGTEASSPGRVVPLDAVSVEANRRWFGGDHAPDRGVTTGMPTLLAARHVILQAYGPEKAAAVAAMLEGPVGPACPASFLRAHPRLRVYLDGAAAAALRHTQFVAS